MTLETLFANTTRDYLEADPTPPASTLVTYVAAHEREDKQRPLISVEVKRDEQTHPEIAALVCVVKLEINVATPNATGTGFTEPTTAEGWVKLIRASLGNGEAFSDYADTLSESDRTGWKMMAYHLQPYYSPEIEAGEHTRTYEQELRITCRVIEPG